MSTFLENEELVQDHLNMDSRFKSLKWNLYGFTALYCLSVIDMMVEDTNNLMPMVLFCFLINIIATQKSLAENSYKRIHQLELEVARLNAKVNE